MCRYKFCVPSTWKWSPCTTLVVRWRCISYQVRPFEQLCQTGNNIFVEIWLAFAWNYHQIETTFHLWHKCGHYRLHLTAYAVAFNCSTVLFADGKPHLGCLHIACAVKYQKISVTHAFGVFVHVVVLIVFFKSVDRLQACFPLIMRKVRDDP